MTPREDKWLKPMTAIVFRNDGEETAYKVTPADFTVGDSVHLDSVPVVAAKDRRALYPKMTSCNPLRPHDLAGLMATLWVSDQQEEIVFPAYAEYEDHTGKIKFRVDWDFKLFPFAKFMRELQTARLARSVGAPDTGRPHLIADNFRFSETKAR